MDTGALLRPTSVAPEGIDSQPISRERLQAILDMAVLSATESTPDQLPELRRKMNRRYSISTPPTLTSCLLPGGEKNSSEYSNASDTKGLALTASFLFSCIGPKNRVRAFTCLMLLRVPTVRRTAL